MKHAWWLCLGALAVAVAPLRAQEAAQGRAVIADLPLVSLLTHVRPLAQDPPARGPK
ncbi:hypothetical protein G4G28_02030 [Massilia sp. Dwa41.01b]|uniref:hypothetical protein n=1 Tax=Massilia sp. Dwa41.01b TaxID=2709302 RepID=UPI001603814F|nr:hypothetical protein [Massilia sp. Dwa41.01b]QNA87546.1 hypothetical protein G4G28_02030 [Massilia sp. Dwa41.01b]